MKWTNEGHEFDAIGKNFLNADKLYIYGCGTRGKELAERLSYCDPVTGFIDYNASAFANGLMGKPVYAPHDFLKMNHENIIVIIAMDDYIYVKKILIYEGFKEGINLFDFYSFLNIYLSIYYLYKFKKLRIHFIPTRITRKCTLKCKYCVGMIPQYSYDGHLDYNILINQIDLTFKNFDYIDEYTFTGGEPFLYPNLNSIIEYLFLNYAQQFKILKIHTNGFFPALNEKLIEMIRTYKDRIQILWSDYRINLKNSEIITKINDNISILKDLDFNVVHIKSDYWIDIAHGKKRDENSESLKTLFNNCYGRCLGIMDDAIHSCTIASNVHKYIFKQEESIDSINLNNSSNKALLLEMYLGFTDNGYAEMCRYCGGCFGVNKNYVLPGEQIE